MIVSPLYGVFTPETYALGYILNEHFLSVLNTHNYHFTQKAPLREAIVSALKVKPRILERKPIVQRIADRLMSLITTFDDA